MSFTTLFQGVFGYPIGRQFDEGLGVFFVACRAIGGGERTGPIEQERGGEATDAPVLFKKRKGKR